MYDEFKGKIISEITNNDDGLIINFTDGSQAEVYNCGEIINGTVELEIDLIRED